MSKRLKRVSSRSDQAAHIWAQQSQDRGNSSNCYFMGKTIYSYGSHFPIASFVDEKTVLFTTRDYSVTTSKHKSEARCALHHDVTVFHVFDVLAGEYKDATKSRHKKNIEIALNEIEEKLLLCAKARAAHNIDRYKNEAESRLENITAYKKYFKVPGKLRAPDLTKVTEIAKAAKKEIDKARKERAERIQKAKDYTLNFILPNWRKYKKTVSAEGVTIDENNHFRLFDNHFLRVKKTASSAIVETSLGVKIAAKVKGEILPFVSALYNACKDCAAAKTGKSFHGSGFKIGDNFNLTSIDENGLAIIGCHRITLEEIENVFKVL